MGERKEGDSSDREPEHKHITALNGKKAGGGNSGVSVPHGGLDAERQGPEPGEGLTELHAKPLLGPAP